MKGSAIVNRFVAAVVLATTAGLLVGAAPANAASSRGKGTDAVTASTGSLSFSGDQGDYISGGQSYVYSSAAGDRLDASGDGNHVSVNVTGRAGDWWYLDIAAPAGQPLQPGTYPNANRYPFQGTGPGLSLDGNGRGCNTLTGSFTIQDATFGPDGYVQTLDATYEQHCEGMTPALRGEVHIANPAPPAPLGLGLAVSTAGEASTLNGRATVHGTVSCTEPAQVTVGGLVTQVKHRTIIRGNYSTTVTCTPEVKVKWSAEADPIGTVPYQKGKAEVKTTATAPDPQYGNTVSVSATTVVTLKKA